MQQECDMAMVHQCLCRLPHYLDIEDVDSVIKSANELYQSHPPNTLRSEVRKYLKERLVVVGVNYLFCRLNLGYNILVVDI